jgi:hypothetical protein
MALIGREAIPVRRHRVILRYALAVEVQEPEIKLSHSVAVLRKATPASDRGHIVVAASSSAHSILDRAGGAQSSKADGKYERGNGCLSPVPTR